MHSLQKRRESWHSRHLKPLNDEMMGFSQPIPAQSVCALPSSLRSSLTYSSMYGVQSAKGLSWLDSIQKMADSIYNIPCVFVAAWVLQRPAVVLPNLREHCLVNQQPQIHALGHHLGHLVVSHHCHRHCIHQQPEAAR